MSSDALIDRLVEDLAPVRPRRAWRDGAMLLAVALAEAVLVALIARPRGDLAEALGTPMFWWKMASCLAIAIAGAAALVLVLDPAESPRRGRRLMLGAAFAAAAIGAAGAAILALPDPLMRRLDMPEGMLCLRDVLILSAPMLLATVWLARRAAPTRPRAAATAAGVASAGWATFVFAWTCPHSDPLYVVVWYGLAVAIVTALARWVLPRLLRW